MMWVKYFFYMQMSMMLAVISVTAQGTDFSFPPEKKTFSLPKASQKTGFTFSRKAMTDYDVIDYQLALSLFPETDSLTGHMRIKLVPLVSLENSLVLNFAGLHLDSTLIGNEPVLFEREGDILTLLTGRTLPAADTLEVILDYHGHPEKGLYFRKNSAGETVIYTHSEPYDARFWFPCKDDPSDKATASVSVRVPGSLRVLSNGRFIGESSAGPGYTLYQWREDYQIATYLISIAAAPYQIVHDQFITADDLLSLQYWLYPPDYERGQKALAQTREMLEFFSRFIGPYPFTADKYAMAEVPLQQAAAMENQTATTMGDFVMDNEGIIAHELAHQWWGDAVTPLDFKDIWLNEGFASYFDALFREYKYGRDTYDIQMEALKTNINNDGSLAYAIYNPPLRFLFGNAVYNKGAWILHMLRHEAGDSVFRKICQSYYQTYQYENVTSADFISVTNDISGRSFGSFFDQWLNYGGLPILIANWSQDRDLVKISIDQFQEEPVYQLNLDILIEGVTKDTLLQMAVMEKISSLDVLFSGTVRQLTLDPYKKLLNTNNTPLFYIPAGAGFLKIFPNPSQALIEIEYQVEKPREVEILLYNILGQRVAVLVKAKQNTGVHQAVWNGQQAASGVYYCLFKSGGIRETRKIVLIK